MSRERRSTRRSAKRKKGKPASRMYIYKNDLSRDESDNPCAYRAYMRIRVELLEQLLKVAEFDENGEEIATCSALLWKSDGDTKYTLSGVMLQPQEPDDDDDEEDEPPPKARSRTRRR